DGDPAEVGAGRRPRDRVDLLGVGIEGRHGARVAGHPRVALLVDGEAVGEDVRRQRPAGDGDRILVGVDPRDLAAERPEPRPELRIEGGAVGRVVAVGIPGRVVDRLLDDAGEAVDAGEGRDPAALVVADPDLGIDPLAELLVPVARGPGDAAGPVVEGVVPGVGDRPDHALVGAPGEDVGRALRGLDDPVVVLVDAVLEVG